MEFITNWVKNIILIILVATFLMMFLPSGSMKKYVRVIMGFFILSVFISPVMSILNQDFDNIYNIIPEDVFEDNWREIETRGSNIREKNTNLVNKEVKNNLKSQISRVIDINYSEWDNRVEIELDQKNYEIKNVSVQLIDESIREIKIEPVELDSGKTSKNKYENKITGIKNKLSNILQISPEVVQVEIINK